MLDLNIEWWELVLRAVIIYMVLMVMVKLSGRRTVGQFTPFDLLVVMLLSEAVSNSLSGGDDSVIGGLISAGTLVLLNILAAWLSSRSEKAANVLDGSPVLLARDGQLYDAALKHCKLSRGEFEQALREHDCSQAEVATAFLEADGTITVQKKKKDAE
jgi:uncharacterized membrane protein YcaP (DUF421 family)